MLELQLLVSFALLGGLLSAIDAAFDRGAFSKRAGFVLAVPTALLFAYAMLLSGQAATILVAILLGCLLSRKVDNAAFFSGAVIVAAALFALGAWNFLLLPLAVLTAAGVVDEAGNDYADRKGAVKRVERVFLRYRPFMKLAVLGLVLLGAFGWIYLFAFIAFDAAYEAVGARFARKI